MVLISYTSKKSHFIMYNDKHMNSYVQKSVVVLSYIDISGCVVIDRSCSNITDERTKGDGRWLHFISH